LFERGQPFRFSELSMARNDRFRSDGVRKGRFPKRFAQPVFDQARISKPSSRKRSSKPTDKIIQGVVQFGVGLNQTRQGDDESFGDHGLESECRKHPCVDLAEPHFADHIPFTAGDAPRVDSDTNPTLGQYDSNHQPCGGETDPTSVPSGSGLASFIVWADTPTETMAKTMRTSRIRTDPFNMKNPGFNN
jgi:hypothetical protein